MKLGILNLYLIVLITSRRFLLGKGDVYSCFRDELWHCVSDDAEDDYEDPSQVTYNRMADDYKNLTTIVTEMRKG